LRSNSRGVGIGRRLAPRSCGLSSWPARGPAGGDLNNARRRAGRRAL
jgi:hypothetical protein